MKSIEEKGIDYAIEMNEKCDGFFNCWSLVDAYAKGASDALASQWRSVEDELPSDGKIVLVHIDLKDDNLEKSMNDAIGHAIAYYRDDHWHFIDEYFYDCKIDRWMPIP